MTTKVLCPNQTPTLRFGANAQIVKEMQRALNMRLAQLDTVTNSPLRIVVSGYFDKETENAVKYLQCLAFLNVDGIVASQTWAYLCRGAASLPQLSIGNAGSKVKTVQQLLKDTDFYFSEVDGIFGAKTAEAVRYFQISSRLTADGIIGETTWNSLSRMKNHASTCSSKIFPSHGYRYI